MCARADHLQQEFIEFILVSVSVSFSAPLLGRLLRTSSLCHCVIAHFFHLGDSFLFKEIYIRKIVIKSITKL